MSSERASACAQSGGGPAGEPSPASQEIARRRAADQVNLTYYGDVSDGRDDYWRKMAAPRFRVATLLRLIAEDPPDALVDLGCGNGALLEEIRTRFPRCRLAGLDLSGAQIEANRVRLPQVTWSVVDLQRPDAIPTEMEGAFLAVVASEIVEHLTDPETFLRNAVRLARPGVGRLLLTTQSGPIRETERRVGHSRHYEKSEAEALLAATGWRPQRIWNAGFPFHDLSKWWANLRPEASLARFSERPYGVAENVLCLALRGAFLLNSRRRGAQLFAVARR